MPERDVYGMRAPCIADENRSARSVTIARVRPRRRRQRLQTPEGSCQNGRVAQPHPESLLTGRPFGFGGEPVSPHADVDPEEHLTSLMAKVEHLLERRLDTALAGHSLTLRQYRLLAMVGRLPGVSSAELARGLLISRQAVSGLVQRLHTAGLIHRTSGLGREHFVLSLTGAGFEILQRATPRATEAEAAALAGLEPAEVDAARLALQRLLHHLAGGHPADGT